MKLLVQMTRFNDQKWERGNINMEKCFFIQDIFHLNCGMNSSFTFINNQPNELIQFILEK